MNFLSLVRTRICLANYRTMWTSRTIFIEECSRASNCPTATVGCMKHPGAPAYLVGSYRCTSSGVSLTFECECTVSCTGNVVDALRQRQMQSHLFNATCNIETNNSKSRFRYNSVNQYKYANFFRPEHVEFNQNLPCVKCEENKMDWSHTCNCKAKEELHSVTFTYGNEIANSSLTQGGYKSRDLHPVSSKCPIDSQVSFLTPGVVVGQNVSNCANLTIVRTFRAYSGAFAKDNDKNDGENNVIKEESHEEEVEEWIHPDNRSDMILDKDPELKSLLRELATDFGKDKSLDDPVKGTDGSDKAENETETEGILKGDVKMQTFDFEAGEVETFEPISTEKAEHNEKKFVFSIDDLVSILREENAQDTCVINIPKEKQYVDYFVVVTGRSPRHLKAMALHVNQQYKSKKTKKDPFVLVEGEDTDDWICIDFGNIVLHLMSEETREFYELEKLWTLGPKYDDQLKRLKEHEMKMKETLDSVDLNMKSIEGQEESADGKPPVISFAR